MNRQTVYIAGPMTGYPEFNQDAFAEAEERFSRLGHTVLNPAAKQIEDLTGKTGFEPCDPEELKRIVKVDLDMVQEADWIYMLTDWEKSVGARAEHAIAVWLGLDIYYE